MRWRRSGGATDGARRWFQPAPLRTPPAGRGALVPGRPPAGGRDRTKGVCLGGTAEIVPGQEGAPLRLRRGGGWFRSWCFNGLNGRFCPSFASWFFFTFMFMVHVHASATEAMAPIGGGGNQPLGIRPLALRPTHGQPCLPAPGRAYSGHAQFLTRGSRRSRGAPCRRRRRRSAAAFQPPPSPPAPGCCRGRG